MVQIYRSKWHRKFCSSLFGYLRDAFVIALPIKRLPRVLTKLLYGIEPKFAFFVHPRTYQDVFVSSPFLELIRFLFRKKTALHILSFATPFVVNSVQTRQNINGFVIGQFTLPEIMFEKRKQTLAQLEKMMRFFRKIAYPEAVVGLGGWFPMVSRRGALLSELGKKLELTVTNGHCGTLSSIYMMVEKIANIGEIKLSELCLAIIGVGKMGANVARAFNGKLAKIILIDINEGSLLKTKQMLEHEMNKTEIIIHISGKSGKPIKDVLKDCHLGVCATSSLRNILTLKDLPIGFIVIDDSRPEAMPRDPRKERIVLEGGMLKIEGAKINYNYGMGEDDNVFGCLGEAFLVALDSKKNLQPTLGDVDMNNFFKLLDFAKENDVVEGDFKSSDEFISDEDIRNAFQRRFHGKFIK